MTLIVYDIETTELAGHPQLDLSVAWVWSSLTDRFEAFQASRVGELARRLNSASMVAGFNIDRFDHPTVHRLAGRRLTAPTFDLLTEVRRARPGTRSGWSLADISAAMLPPWRRKIGDGACAPGLYRRGAIDELYTYALEDLRTIVAVLFEAVRRGGVVTNGVDTVRVNVARLAAWLNRSAIHEGNHHRGCEGSRGRVEERTAVHRLGGGDEDGGGSAARTGAGQGADVHGQAGVRHEGGQG